MRYVVVVVLSVLSYSYDFAVVLCYYRTFVSTNRELYFQNEIFLPKCERMNHYVGLFTNQMEVEKVEKYPGIGCCSVNLRYIIFLDFSRFSGPGLALLPGADARPLF